MPASGIGMNAIEYVLNLLCIFVCTVSVGNVQFKLHHELHDDEQDVVSLLSFGGAPCCP